MEKGWASKIKEQPDDDRLELVVAPIPSASPVVPPLEFPKALDRILSNAALNNSTELLVERETNTTRIRQRIRGVLITDLRATLSPSELSETFGFVMKVGEKKSEEGLTWASANLSHSLNGNSYFCRFLLSETQNFGLITIHLARLENKTFNPSAWGMGPSQAGLLENFLGRSHGLILFCGTETDDLFPYIQSISKQLITPERHVIAVGAQAQAWFPGVEQMVSNNNPELFSKILKLAFRHEPDLLVAHPVERKEHMDICLSEAVRGKLVFARVFASDVVDALMQLLGMGVEPYLMGAGLMGVVAQRTIRLNCQRCQEKEIIQRDRLKEIGIPVGMQPTAFFHGKGCEACFKTGFDRETNIFEIVEMSDDLRSRLNNDLKQETLRSLMKSRAMMTLRQVGLHKAINGQTSLSEVLRVTP